MVCEYNQKINSIKKIKWQYNMLQLRIQQKQHWETCLEQWVPGIKISRIQVNDLIMHTKDF